MAKTKSGASRRAAARRKAARRRVMWETAAALVVVVVFAVLFGRIMAKSNRDMAVMAYASPVPTDTPAPTDTPEPVVTATPEPTPSPTPSPEPTPSPTATPEPTPVPDRVEVEYPYAIIVDRGAQVVTIMTIGETGKYDVVARQMICSTDKYVRKPTNGVYKLDGSRYKWLSTLLGSYVQYATRISGTILFHSLPYTTDDPAKMMADEYRNLGKNVSEGCVRLTCEDAKWIYENIPTGTLVWFRSGEFDEELLKTLAPPALLSGKWDPTDDRAENIDYIGGSYHLTPVATPFPYVTPMPTHYDIITWG